ncbi:hypothetical protein [Ruminococcus sp.]|uniref:hypothetical protein n=1 Tax=Ruminococcus sp. TaxID=41978 RepID=UPI0025D7AF56|nr:hypothetical protein [Ruminococcus sp.]
MTKFSNWVIYTASYLPLSIFQTIRFVVIIIKETNDTTKHSTILEVIKVQGVSQIIILLLSLLCYLDFIIFAILIHKTNANERIYSRIKNNSLVDMIGFLGFYILSLLTIESDYIWLIINAIGYIVVGIVITKSEKIYLCPSYLFLGYLLYETDDDHKVLVRLSREKYNILLDDSSNGIEAKQLTVTSHLVKTNK